MKRLPKPTLDAAAVFDSCVGGVPEAALTARFQAAGPELLELGQQYDVRAALNQLHLFPAAHLGHEGHQVVQAVTKGELNSLYSKHMVPRNQQARRYYDQLALTELGKCPYCGFGHVSTLDHFLSKARYPAFSVLPINLVPSCSDCNHGKGSGVIAEGDQIPHPYYESAAIETDTWLHAGVEETMPPTARFFVDPPPHWPGPLAVRVRNYFRNLNLATRFAVEAASELVSLSDLLATLKTSELIGIQLHQVATVERAHRRNTWKAALYDALSHSDWYRAGGWRRAPPV